MPNKESHPATPRPLNDIATDMLELAPVGAYVYSLVQKKHVYVNPKNFQITGYDLLALQQMPLEKFFHPDDIGIIVSSIEQLRNADDDPVLTGDYRLLTSDGQYKWFRSRSTVFRRDKSGKTTEILGYFWNIDDLKATENRLKKSKETSQQYLEVAQVMMVALNTERQVTLVNSKSCEVLGYSREEILGEDWFKKFIPAHETQGVEEVYRQIMAGDLTPVEYFENHLACKDGKKRLIAWHNSLTWDDEGKISGLLSSGTDITIQKALEEKHKTHFDQVISILDGLAAVVYVTDMKSYEILYINKHTRKLFGDVKGKVCWQTLQTGMTEPCDFCTNDRLLDENGQPTGPYFWEFQNTKMGTWHRMVDRAIHWTDGRIVRLEIATDITDLKKADEEKKQLIEKLEATLEEIKTLKGILPICSYCKKIRDDEGYWERVESYIHKHTEAEFSHGICPNCLEEHFPQED